ncbi:Secreted effector protein pipB2 [Mycobacterium marinum]|uniref:pentapeptide repeat-containing protein n=1 Tax=Mycobacterium marinum TaxID=1781 RepID=UPI000E3BE3C7|nr:pentapeptide repeat-containing protein [Mycobacterium marinum]RFZ15066.1 Secreted effector protein pipB2 [Mycobacterium marinum]
MIEIKSTTGAVLYTAAHAQDVRQAVTEAVKAGANLADANLADANLARANLVGANLVGANLADAYLARANLVGANLVGANLADANLARANLADANLARANLADANLVGANLADANLARAKHIDLVAARLSVLPDEGDVIAWKKAQSGVLVKLRIPDGVRRSNATGRKCRAELAEVLAIFDADGQPCEVASSTWDSGFTYRVGETVRPVEPFDDNRWRECASGIHFYITRAEAEAHL